MRVAQIVLPGASEYERKCQRVDFAGLTALGHEAIVVDAAGAAASGAAVAHVYAPRALPASLFAGFSLPYVASGAPPVSRWSFRRPAPPARIVSPLFDKGAAGRETFLPEAVEDTYFDERPRAREAGGPKRIATFFRAGIRNAVEQALVRIHRTRDDVIWDLLTAPPSPEVLAGMDLWVDPAVAEDDLDGFVAEAQVAGLPVVASRTAANEARLEHGRTGVLVPAGDPNEMTHAILLLLFKPEIAEVRLQAARQTVSKFRGRQRLRSLVEIYQSLHP